MRQTCRVVNRKDVPIEPYGKFFDPYVDIRRPTKWGNKFVLDKDGNRKEVISKHGAWILEQPELLRALSELFGKTLVCQCKPLPCHGDNLKYLIEHYEEVQEMAAKRKSTKKSSKRSNSRSSSRETRDSRSNGRDRDDNRGQGNGRGRSSSKNDDRFRLTGLWEAKNRRGMFTGTMKDENDIVRLEELCAQVRKGTGRLVFFMFENDRKRSQRDPEFTIYADEGQEPQQNGGRGRSSRDGNGGHRGREEEYEDRGRGRGRDRIDQDDNRRDPDDNF